MGVGRALVGRALDGGRGARKGVGGSLGSL